MRVTLIFVHASFNICADQVCMHLEANQTEALPIEPKCESDAHRTYPFPHELLPQNLYKLFSENRHMKVRSIVKVQEKKLPAWHAGRAGRCVMGQGLAEAGRKR